MPKPNYTLIDAVAGSGAGAIASFVTCPLDVVKTRLIIQSVPNSTPNMYMHPIGIVETLKEILKKEGIKGWYHGLRPTLMGLVPTWGVYFASYSQLKGVFSKVGSPDSAWIHIASAMGAGMINNIFTYPLWVIKTRLQTQHLQGRKHDQYKGTLSGLRVIFREEGIRGLYSGLTPSLLGLIHVGVQFPTYEKLKSIYAKKKNRSVENLGPLDLVFASSGSKVVASVVAYPHEVLRARLQDQTTQSRYNGSIFACFKQIVQEEGVRGMYKGMGTNLLRVVPACAITFTSYEIIKRWLLKFYDS